MNNKAVEVAKAPADVPTAFVKVEFQGLPP
jgi:hypothetical protein